MHGNWFSDYEAICNKLSDGLTRVGIADFTDFIRIEPDLALAAANDTGSKAFLCRKVDPVKEGRVSIDDA